MNVHPLEIALDRTSPTLVTRRVIASRRSLVFDALTRPEYIKRWMGPRAYLMLACEVDLRVGGAYRMVHRGASGQEVRFRGVFREIERPARIVRTFAYDSAPEHVAVETIVLEEHGGLTAVTTTTVHPTFEARDAHLAGDQMEACLAEGYTRLEALLAPLRREESHAQS